MMTPIDYLNQLTSYIRKNTKKGYTKEILRQALIDQGHSIKSIEKAFKKIDNELVKKVPILKTKPKITYERLDSKKKSGWKKFF